MPDNNATGQAPGGAGETPILTTNTANVSYGIPGSVVIGPSSGSGQTPPSTPAEGQELDGEEEPFDRDRAMRTIRKLREEAKRATAAIKELDQLRAEKQAAEDAKLGDLERRDKRIQQLEAEIAFGKQEQQDRINHYEVQLHAARLGIVDPDAAVKLLPWGDLEYGDDGRPKDIEGALKQLIKQRPYLAGQMSAPPISVGNPATRAAGPGQRTFTRADISDYAFYTKHRDEIVAALREGRVTD